MVLQIYYVISVSQPYSALRNFFFYHGFADLLRHIRVPTILRAHFGFIRSIYWQINARVRLAYRLVITCKYAYSPNMLAYLVSLVYR